jgi:CRP-like cAMP-binding protein
MAMPLAIDTTTMKASATAAHNPFRPVPVDAMAAHATMGNQDEDLRALQRLGAKVRFARNATIFNEGDEATQCYKVISGAVRLCKHMSDGRRQIADFLLPGDMFGFLQFGAYKFTAEAVDDAVLMRYPQQQIERLSKTMPAMRSRLLVLLSQRLLDMQDHLVMLGRQTAKERVVSFLLLIAERSGAEEGCTFDLPMGRQDMADYLGLTIETVCRMLSELKRAKIIAVRNGAQIVINDLERLHDLASGAEAD